MANNGNIGFLKSVEVFADTMGDRFTDNDPNNCMIIIAHDKEQTLEVVFGGNGDSMLDALSTAIYQSEGLADLIIQALGIVVTSKIKNNIQQED